MGACKRLYGLVHRDSQAVRRSRAASFGIYINEAHEYSRQKNQAGLGGTARRCYLLRFAKLADRSASFTLPRRLSRVNGFSRKMPSSRIS